MKKPRRWLPLFSGALLFAPAVWGSSGRALEGLIVIPFFGFIALVLLFWVVRLVLREARGLGGKRPERPARPPRVSRAFSFPAIWLAACVLFALLFPNFEGSVFGLLVWCVFGPLVLLTGIPRTGQGYAVFVLIYAVILAIIGRLRDTRENPGLERQPGNLKVGWAVKLPVLWVAGYAALIFFTWDNTLFNRMNPSVRWFSEGFYFPVLLAIYPHPNPPAWTFVLAAAVYAVPISFLGRRLDRARWWSTET